jgi:hypothetical protein
MNLQQIFDGWIKNLDKKMGQTEMKKRPPAILDPIGKGV